MPGQLLRLSCRGRRELGTHKTSPKAAFRELEEGQGEAEAGRLTGDEETLSSVHDGQTGRRIRSTHRKAAEVAVIRGPKIEGEGKKPAMTCDPLRQGAATRSVLVLPKIASQEGLTCRAQKSVVGPRYW